MTEVPARPPSVELGTVIPPEDPEDWHRPLTWQIAAGMLAAPLAGLAWFVGSPPTSIDTPAVWTYAVAAILAAGAALVGSTQRGALRTTLATIGTGLFEALGLVLVASLVGGEARSVEIAAPGIAQGLAAAVAGLGGVLAAASLGALLANRATPVRRFASPALGGAITAVIFVRVLLPG